LIPLDVLRRIALTFAEGAPKYGDRTWESGLAYSEVMDHVMEHLAKYWEHDVSEDHLAKAAWGLIALMYYDAHDLAGANNDWSGQYIMSGPEGVETFDAKVAQARSERDLRIMPGDPY